MIARVWRGWARADLADDYQRHYQTHVADVLREVTGFRGALLLRRGDLDEVMFTSITVFTDLDAVIGFAGADCQRAVVEEAARRVLTRWDHRVTHHEIAVDLLP